MQKISMLMRPDIYFNQIDLRLAKAITCPFVPAGANFTLQCQFLGSLNPE